MPVRASKPKRVLTQPKRVLAPRASTHRNGARPRIDKPKVQQRVLSWFDEHGRSLPWRAHRDPYGTLVAEVMLQQTQTGRVGPIYDEFLQRFPTLEQLAHAPAMEVIRAWRGLGYNRRAVDLQATAQEIAHRGEFPSDPNELKRLPGVGEYSANAIACFAFDRQVPVVDVNVKRTLARTVRGVEDDQIDTPTARALAQDWLPAGEAYRWNQALMDIGAMICRPEKPLCPKCPLKVACLYYAKGKHKVPRGARAAKEPFEGSARQKRGGIIDQLRDAAEEGISLAALAKAIHPGESRRELGWLVELLEGLERDGLVQMSPGARKGSPRGLVRLPG